MELADIFNRVAQHLLQQNKKALHAPDGGPSRLMYVTPAGLKDSIGCLIPSNLYHPDMEGYVLKGVGTWKQWSDNDGLTKLRDALRFNGINVYDEKCMRLLTDLQNIHDNHEPEFWASRLTATARTWRLSDSLVEYEVYQQRTRAASRSP